MRTRTPRESTLRSLVLVDWRRDREYSSVRRTRRENVGDRNTMSRKPDAYVSRYSERRPHGPLPRILVLIKLAEWDAFDVDCLIERRGIAGEEGGAHGIANHGDEGAGMVFLVGEEAAVDHADIANVGHGGGSAQYGSVLADQVVALDIGDVLAVWAVEHAVAGEGFHEALVIGMDGLVTLDFFEVLAAGETAGGGDLRHQERLRPEGFGGA